MTGSAQAAKSPEIPNTIQESLQPKKAEKPDWEKEVLVPLKTKQAEEEAAAQAAEAARIAAEEATRLAQQVRVYTAPVRAYTASYGTLTGSLGYARAGGNCVNEPGVNRSVGNPISWPVLSGNPWIGATALFTYNHVGVVVGIWSNGDLEIRHQNFTGGLHRFPRWQFRGFR